MSLRIAAYSAVRWTAAGAAIRMLLHLAQLAILARLLAPADYGLMAIVFVMLALTGVLSDLGVNSAYVQRQDVTPGQRSSLFWLNVAMSAGLSGLMLAASPAVAWFFGDPRLAHIVAASAPIFIINALGHQIRMTAEKSLKFRPVFFMEVLSTALGFGAAVAAALYGLGVYALVISMLVTALSATSIAWLVMTRGWRPGWHFRFSDVKSYLGFGGAMIGNNFVNQVNLNIDLLLGGRLLSATELGLYSVPRQLVLRLQFMINPIITRVGFPLIAKVQHDALRVREIYLKTLNMTASTNAPLYLGLSVFAPEVVSVMLGQRWAESSEFLRIFGVWGFLRSTANPVGILLFGMGRANLALKWNIAYLFIGPPVLWVGSQFGPLGIAWALLIMAVIMFAPAWYFLVRPLCSAGLIEYSIVTLRPMVLAAVSLLAAYVAVIAMDSAIVRLIVGALVAAPIYLALSNRYNREWINSLRELLGGQAPAS